eukprot:TRINITY_DN1865_c0_g1_i2.p1 TRINITY_DN1865_c0_g1~~TRINITY_DN1865_c0_g1_i2.p1  ORF type:complete len:1652 (+),score=320.74 TRINITY_DN1865_c0_g1_i2:64-5019(+)
MRRCLTFAFVAFVVCVACFASFAHGACGDASSCSACIADTTDTCVWCVQTTTCVSGSSSGPSSSGCDSWKYGSCSVASSLSYLYYDDSLVEGQDGSVGSFVIQAVDGASGEPLNTGGDEALLVPTAQQQTYMWAKNASAGTYYGPGGGYEPFHVIGPPNVFRCGDDSDSWSPISSGGPDWLRVTYNMSVRPTAIDIYETDGAPFVRRLDFYSSDNTLVYSMANVTNYNDTAKCKTDTNGVGPFSLKLQSTNFNQPINSVYIAVQAAPNAGWPGLDAVSLYYLTSSTLTLSYLSSGRYLVNTTKVGRRAAVEAAIFSAHLATDPAQTPLRGSGARVPDPCTASTQIQINDVVTGSTRGAYTLTSPCVEAVPERSVPGAWYHVIGTGRSVYLAACTNGTDAANINMAIYTATSDVCPDESSLSCVSSSSYHVSHCALCDNSEGYNVWFDTVLDQKYFIYVQQPSSSAVTFSFSVHEGSQFPYQQNYTQAYPIQVNTKIEGDLLYGSSPDYYTCNGFHWKDGENTLFYTFQGTGGRVRASVCFGVEFDVDIDIYTINTTNPTFPPPLCPVASPLLKTMSCGAASFSSASGYAVAYNTTVGTTYYIEISSSDCSDLISYGFTLYLDDVSTAIDDSICPFGTVVIDASSPFKSREAELITLIDDCVYQVLQPTLATFPPSSSGLNWTDAETHATIQTLDLDGSDLFFLYDIQPPAVLRNALLYLFNGSNTPAAGTSFSSRTGFTVELEFRTGRETQFQMIIDYNSYSDLRDIVPATGSLSYLQAKPGGVFITERADSSSALLNYNNYTLIQWIPNFGERYVRVNFMDIRTSEAKQYFVFPAQGDSLPGSPVTGNSNWWVGMSCILFQDNIIVYGGSDTDEVIDEAKAFWYLNLNVDPSSYEMRPFSVSGSLPSRTQHSMTLVGDVAYIFGGYNYFENGAASYYLPVETTLFALNVGQAPASVVPVNVPFTAARPSPRGWHSTTSYRTDSFVLYGGLYQNTTRGIGRMFEALGDLWMFNVTTKTWILLDNGKNGGPHARYGNGIVIYDDYVFVLSGYDSDSSIVQDIWRWDLLEGGWEVVPVQGPSYAKKRSPTAASVALNDGVMWRAAVSTAVIGDYVFMGGGSEYDSHYEYLTGFQYGTISLLPIQYTLSKKCLRGAIPSLDECSYCVDGMNTVDTVAGALCERCSPGYYNNLYTNQSCFACPVGSFQEFSGQPSCSYCPAGFSSVSIGSSSHTQCLPCPPGTYSNVPGSTICKPCNATTLPKGMICPIASLSPINLGIVTSQIVASELDFILDESTRYLPFNNFFFFTFLGVVLLWLALLGIVWLVGKIRKTGTKYSQLDYFQEDTYVVPGPILKNRSSLGGAVTLFAGCAIVGIMTVILLMYRYNNYVLVSSVVPGTANTDTVVNHAVSRVRFYGYSGPCEAVSRPGVCDPLAISIFVEGSQAPGTRSCKQIDFSTCELVWTSDGTNRIKSSAYLLYSAVGPQVSAYAVWWNISVNSIYSAKKGLDSYTTGFLQVEANDTLFRGGKNDLPCLVQISLIPTSYDVYNAPDDHADGLTVGFLTRQPGNTVNTTSFYNLDGDQPGIYLRMEIQLSSFTYEKNVIERMGALTAVSNFVALTGGALTIGRLAVIYYLKVSRRFKKKDKNVELDGTTMN